MTTVSEVMTRGARTITPQDQAMLAAQLMDQMDVGSLPVCEAGKLVGVVTDRDLVVRGLAKRQTLEGAQVKEFMSNEVAFCFENQSVEEVLEYMGGDQLRRLPVLDQEKRLVGIVTLGDIASKEEQPKTDEALAEISTDLPK
ncbi:CBS domain-containing protein [Herbaspirillum sp. WGmk3]|uniref:CBS domain-containing protein n=1 Tax=Herbaspirillum sp. WGmk3 TaxID=2919925 RepID=UPI0020917C3F|nr:CBS domain-containing protein [Herbaspirillum sp. WGmk3]MCO4857257.1 CBS domain-containing protein [Herbaspirillum sp. WGmk3]